MAQTSIKAGPNVYTRAFPYATNGKVERIQPSRSMQEIEIGDSDLRDADRGDPRRVSTMD